MLYEVSVRFDNPEKYLYKSHNTDLFIFIISMGNKPDEKSASIRLTIAPIIEKLKNRAINCEKQLIFSTERNTMNQYLLGNVTSAVLRYHGIKITSCQSEISNYTLSIPHSAFRIQVTSPKASTRLLCVSPDSMR